MLEEKLAQVSNMYVLPLFMFVRSKFLPLFIFFSSRRVVHWSMFQEGANGNQRHQLCALDYRKQSSTM